MPAVVVSGSTDTSVATVVWQQITPVITASGEAAGFPAINVNDPATWSSWKADGSNGWIKYDLGGATSIDAIGIAAHTLGSSGATALVQYGGDSRTNLIVRSEELDNGVWIHSRITISADAIVAPDGTLTADKLVENTENGAHGLSTPIAGYVSGTNYTLSAYVKAAERSFVLLSFIPTTHSVNVGARFNLATGDVLLPSAALTDYGCEDAGNGWWRVWVSAPATITTASARSVIHMATGPAPGDNPYTGDGSSGLYVWGVQLEVGTAPTSYIPTAASSVTSDWHDATSWVTPTDNADMLFLIPSTNSAAWRLSLTGPAANIGILQVGKRLVFPNAPLDDYTPLNMAREYTKLRNQSLKGQLLGNRVIAAGARTEVDLGYVTRTWADTNLPAFKSHYDQGGTFFYAGCPSKFPLDMGYCWSDGDNDTIAVSYVEADRLSTVSFAVRSYVPQ